MKNQILIVCADNVYRSVIAETCLNETLRIKRTASYEPLQLYRVPRSATCISRGLTGCAGKSLVKDFPALWLTIKPVLSECGVVMPTDRLAQEVSSTDIEESSIILAMDESVSETLQRLFPECKSKMLCTLGYLEQRYREKPTDCPVAREASDVDAHRSLIKYICKCTGTSASWVIACLFGRVDAQVRRTRYSCDLIDYLGNCVDLS